MRNRKVDYKTRLEIKNLYIDGYSVKYLSQKFKLHPQVIVKIAQSKICLMMEEVEKWK
ncbi:hypothetical protein [uncultured Clostridium sp.]|jgi:hypothetical protein|uniref:hypothetical protein n=1 Tax=uncultured Clostridium sp. TaxID=59620 RepID=UPI00261BCF3E|nr:hypothetical protein [uncultured Clostridium sp.]